MEDEDFVDAQQQEIREMLEKLGVLMDADGDFHSTDDLFWTSGGPKILDSWEAAVNTANAFNMIMKPYGSKEIIPAYFMNDGTKGRESALKFAVVEARHVAEYSDFDIEFIVKLAGFFDEYAKMEWARTFLASKQGGQQGEDGK